MRETKVVAWMAIGRNQAKSTLWASDRAFQLQSKPVLRKHARISVYRGKRRQKSISWDNFHKLKKGPNQAVQSFPFSFYSQSGTRFDSHKQSKTRQFIASAEIWANELSQLVLAWSGGPLCLYLHQSALSSWARSTSKPSWKLFEKQSHM